MSYLPICDLTWRAAQLPWRSDPARNPAVAGTALYRTSPRRFLSRTKRFFETPGMINICCLIERSPR